MDYQAAFAGLDPADVDRLLIEQAPRLVEILCLEPTAERCKGVREAVKLAALAFRATSERRRENLRAAEVRQVVEVARDAAKALRAVTDSGEVLPRVAWRFTTHAPFLAHDHPPKALLDELATDCEEAARCYQEKLDRLGSGGAPEGLAPGRAAMLELLVICEYAGLRPADSLPNGKPRTPQSRARLLNGFVRACLDLAKIPAPARLASEVIATMKSAQVAVKKYEDKQRALDAFPGNPPPYDELAIQELLKKRRRQSRSSERKPRPDR